MTSFVFSLHPLSLYPSHYYFHLKVFVKLVYFYSDGVATISVFLFHFKILIFPTHHLIVWCFFAYFSLTFINAAWNQFRFATSSRVSRRNSFSSHVSDGERARSVFSWLVVSPSLLSLNVRDILHCGYHGAFSWNGCKSSQQAANPLLIA